MRQLPEGSQAPPCRRGKSFSTYRHRGRLQGPAGRLLTAHHLCACEWFPPSGRIPSRNLLLLTIAENEDIIIRFAQIDLRNIAFENRLVDDEMLQKIKLFLPAILGKFH